MGVYMEDKLKIEDIVKYKDRIYIIENINQETVTLVGYSYRDVVTTNISNLIKANQGDIEKENKNNIRKITNITDQNKRNKKNKNALFGRILHIDGDKRYLESCMNLYKKIGVDATGVYIHECNIHKKIEEIILELHPDVVVITGHDNYNGEDIKEINNYENSKFFIEAVRKIRNHFTFNELVIIAGACSSHFEAIIASGANFASSPKRINTHTYDPAVVAVKVATTSCNQLVDFNNIIKYIEKGKDAIGGIETYGKMKMLL